jgi:hypothetical protein
LAFEEEEEEEEEELEEEEDEEDEEDEASGLEMASRFTRRIAFEACVCMCIG